MVEKADCRVTPFKADGTEFVSAQSRSNTASVANMLVVFWPQGRAVVLIDFDRALASIG
jgi:hypothetical protein